VFVYRDVPFDVLEEINKDTSLGKLVSKIKKLCKPVTGTKVFPEGAIKWDPASGLPPPKPKTKANGKPTRGAKKWKDYSIEWLTVLENVSRLSSEDLQGLVDQLSGLHPQYAPAKKPRFSAQKSDSGAELLCDYNDMAGYSMFNLLSLDDDDSSSEEEEDSHAGKTAASSSISSAVPAVPLILTKHILAEVKCALAEATRNAAVAAQKQKNYNDYMNYWCDAYDIMNDILACTDPWAAELADKGAKREKVQNPALVKEIVEGVSVLREDTVREKDNSIGRLYQRQEFLVRKLSPQITDRNAAREEIGEEKWKSNPAPKHTYAERRMLTEKELHDVSIAINTIEPLVLLETKNQKKR
jgi:hypothetical protein